MSETQNQSGHFRRNWIIYTLLVLALGAVGYFWISKTSALKKQAKVFEEQKVAIIEQAEKSLQSTVQQHLEMMMKTFVWAVRGEMTRDNLEQVDQYFKQLVKTESIREITLVDKTGKILISTNKKNEGSTLPEEYAEQALRSEEVSIIDQTDKQIVSAPVMSLDSRLGTLVLTYHSERLVWNTSNEVAQVNQ